MFIGSGQFTVVERVNSGGVFDQGAAREYYLPRRANSFRSGLVYDNMVDNFYETFSLSAPEGSS